METIDSPENSLPQQIERVRALASEALQAPDSAAVSPLASALFDFHALTRDARYLEDAGETARSLAALLHHCGDRRPNEQERPQIVMLLGNLLHELSPESRPTLQEVAPPLVTPIAPSSATVNKRVALFVDNATQLVLLQQALQDDGFEPMEVPSLDVLAEIDAARRPAAIIADLALCHLQPGCGEVFAALRRRFSPAPHLFCIAASTDIAARLDAVRLGATRFLPQPVDTARLLAILKGVTRQTPMRPFRVVVVEDDPFLGELYRDGLDHAGIVVLVVNDPLQAPARIAEFGPDLIVSDLFMPGCNGFELLTVLRQDDALVDTPIVLLSSEQDGARQLEAQLPAGDPAGSAPDMELDHYFFETINMDDYVVSEVDQLFGSGR